MLRLTPNLTGDVTSVGNATTVVKLGTTGTSVTVNTAAPPTTGQVLTATSATAADWATPASPGTGTVTSVGLSDGSTTPIYNITGSPVTTSGTLTFALATETANTVFAGLLLVQPLNLHLDLSYQPMFRHLIKIQRVMLLPLQLLLT